MLKQQVDLVDVDPGAFAQRAVSDDSVEDAVQHHQHPDGQKLFAQITDVVAKNPGVGVHIGGLGEGVEAAVCEQLHGQGHVSGLRLRLLQQLRMKVLQGWGLPLVVALEVVAIDIGGAAVNDGLFPGVELVAAHQLFAEGQQKLGF